MSQMASQTQEFLSPAEFHSRANSCWNGYVVVGLAATLQSGFAGHLLQTRADNAAWHVILAMGGMGWAAVESVQLREVLKKGRRFWEGHDALHVPALKTSNRRRLALLLGATFTAGVLGYCVGMPQPVPPVPAASEMSLQANP